jgi:hypothetical protein
MPNCVINYETFARIHDCRDRQGLTIAQTARACIRSQRTVARRVGIRRRSTSERSWLCSAAT